MVVARMLACLAIIQEGDFSTILIRGKILTLEYV